MSMMSDQRQKENNENVSPSRGLAKELNEQKEEQHHQNEPEQLTTKIYYYVDDQQIPFATEIPIPPSKITLTDFKKECLSRRNYRYYCKLMDSALNAEVKTEIRDENEVLKPNSTTGRIELFLLSESQTQSSASTLPIQQLQHCGIRTSLMAKRTSAHYTYEPKAKYIDDSSSPEDTNLRLFGESNFAGSLSDGDSQYTTTDFTSVSQQNTHNNHFPRRTFPDLRNLPYKAHVPMPPNPNRRYDSNNKPCWTREKRKRLRKCHSALSSTFEDTEISMALDLITVTFNLDTRRPFGMSIVTKNNRSGFAGIYVHDVNPGGLVALDGRIRPGFAILEVNDIPLDEYDSKEALNLIISSVRHATETRGQLKLACARSETIEPIRSIFNPVLAEPVRPIDPTAWVQHTNAARGLDQQVAIQAHQHHHIPSACLPEPPPTTAPIPKSATIPKTNLHMIGGQGHSNTNPVKQFDSGIRLIQNPSTDITTTSGGHSSLECSIGQVTPVGTNSEESKKRSGGGGRKAKKREGGGGGIGRALRRLMCIQKGRRGKGSGRK